MTKMSKNFLFGLVIGLISVTALTLSASATEFRIFTGMDTYYATDNASLPPGSGGERPFAVSNNFKDIFGINDAVIGAHAQSDLWRANVELDMCGAYNFEAGQINAGFKLFKNLWIEGGLFYTSVPGEYDNFTWDNYFTSYSVATQGAPCKEMGIGLAYNFSENTTAHLRVVNSGFGEVFDNNRSKSIVARINFAEIVPDWTLSIGTLLGNEEGVRQPEQFMTFTAVDLRGKFSRNLEGILTVQCATKNDAKVDDNGELSMGLHYGVTAQARYHFSEKFNASVRVAYADDKDGVLEDYPGFAPMEFGVNFEYRPLDFMYLRLEGGFLSLSAEDEDDAKIFVRDNDVYNTRMQVALSMGVSFDVYNSLK